MYGTGIGTGAAGTAALTAGMATGSWVLMAVMALCFAAMAVTLVRNHRRRASNQRP